MTPKDIILEHNQHCANNTVQKGAKLTPQTTAYLSNMSHLSSPFLFEDFLFVSKGNLP